MQVRFQCPACGGSHVFDMPETTVYMTCGRTRKTLQLRLTTGGDVRVAVVGEGAAQEAEAGAEEE